MLWERCHHIVLILEFFHKCKKLAMLAIKANISANKITSYKIETFEIMLYFYLNLILVVKSIGVQTKVKSNISQLTLANIIHSVGHQNRTQEVLVSIPTEDNFLLNIFYSSLCKTSLLTLPTFYNYGKTLLSN